MAFTWQSICPLLKQIVVDSNEFWQTQILIKYLNITGGVTQTLKLWPALTNKNLLVYQGLNAMYNKEQGPIFLKQSDNERVPFYLHTDNADSAHCIVGSALNAGNLITFSIEILVVASPKTTSLHCNMNVGEDESQV